MSGQDWEQLTLFPADSPASPFLLPGSAEARRMTATSGQKCCGLLRNCSPVGLLARMLLGSSQWRSTRCYLTWKLAGTPQGRLLFRLVPSVRPIEETGCGLLPTVTASDFKQRGPNSRQQGLPEKIFAMLPTPQAADSSIGAVIGRNDRFILTKNGVPRKINQNGQNGSVGLGRIFRLMCTPTATDWKGGSTRRQRAFQRSSLRSEVHADFGSGRTSQLNPLFVEEMMGFPTGWISRPFLKEVAIQAEAQPLIDGEQNP